jgi:NADPH-dependent glutamate synthase beta subunit-like oxidoreductase
LVRKQISILLMISMKMPAKVKLEPNRWGDIDADRYTLQTGIQGVFAAGDGVSGPATIIEAIAQATNSFFECASVCDG